MGNNKSKVWRGLTATGAMLLAASVTASTIVTAHRTDIDKMIGTQSTQIVNETNASPEELYTYSSDYSSTTELVQAMQDIGTRMSQEGSVLLKNNNAALPLSAEELGKVSLLGFQSYFPNKGAILGPTAAENHGTEADTVDLVGALEARGFTLNATLKDMYNSDAQEHLQVRSGHLDGHCGVPEPDSALGRRRLQGQRAFRRRAGQRERGLERQPECQQCDDHHDRPRRFRERGLHTR